MDSLKHNEVVVRLSDKQPEEFSKKVFDLYTLKPLPGAQTLLMANRRFGKYSLAGELHKCLIEKEFAVLTVDFQVIVAKNNYEKCWFNEWPIPKVSGKKAWEPAKWQGGTDHTAPLKHGKDPKAVAKRRKKKKLASKR